MIRRPESLRERTLLRVIESQQRQIEDLTNRLMYLVGQAWQLPPLPEHTRVEEDVPLADWTATPEQSPVY